jgi:hypothetical protein
LKLKYVILAVGLTGLFSCAKVNDTPPPPPHVIVPQTAKDIVRMHAPVTENIYFTDIRDLATYKKNAIAKALLKTFTNSIQSYFDDGTTFDQKGPSLDIKTRSHSVFGVEILTINKIKESGPYEILIGALYTDEKSVSKYRTWWVYLDSNLKMTRVLLQDDGETSQMALEVRVGLLQRKLVVELESGYKIIYPLGVGGFDNDGYTTNDYRLLTPILHEGFIPPGAIIDARTDPDYYLGRPFIRIFDEKKQYTPIGFHIQQFGAAGMKRSFVSHGCMHMREKDLYEFFTLLKSSKIRYVPLRVDLTIEDSEDHPYPLLTNAYKIISYRKNEEGVLAPTSNDQPPLLDLRWVKGSAPISHVVGDTSWIEQP